MKRRKALIHTAGFAGISAVAASNLFAADLNKRFGGCINYKKDLPFELFELDFISSHVICNKIVDGNSAMIFYSKWY